MPEQDWRNASLTNQYQQDVTAGWRDPVDLNMAKVIDRDKLEWESQLKRLATQYGVPYDATDLDGLIRNQSYSVNDSRDPAAGIENQRQIYARRAATGDTDAPGGNTHYDTQNRPFQVDSRGTPGVQNYDNNGPLAQTGRSSQLKPGGVGPDTFHTSSAFASLPSPFNLAPAQQQAAAPLNVQGGQMDGPALMAILGPLLQAIQGMGGR